MDKRLFIALFIIGVVCVSLFSGCVSQPPSGSEKAGMTAQEVLDKSFQVSGAADAYSYKMSMRASMAGNDTGGAGMDVMTVSGEVDKTNKKMHVSTAMNPMMSVQDTETYIIGKTYYSFNSSEGWVKGNTTNDNLWEQASVQGMQEELMNSSNVSFLPEEQLDGIDCYVLNVTPDMDKLPQLLGRNTDLQEQSLNSITAASIREDVDKNSFLIKRLLFVIDMQDTGGIIMRMETTIDFSDYGKEMYIELPKDAKNAKAVS